MSKDSLSLLFAGTPELAATALHSILATDWVDIHGVITQPDRPSGRGRKLTASPVKTLAEAHNLTIFQPANKTELQAISAISEVDVLVVAAYGMILPAQTINQPVFGSLNIHTSLLPRWRGAAPIQRAIEAGDAMSGVSIMQMDSGLDTGDILLQKSCPISATETSATLHDKLAVLGAEAIVEVLSNLKADPLPPEKQDEALACYAHKLQKPEAELDWQLPATVLERKVRAFNPAPVCFCQLQGHRLRIWQASVMSEAHNLQAGDIVCADKHGIRVACGEDSLLLQQLQPAGKKVMPAIHFLNGHPDFLTP